ncbi:MAG: hypothetical protein ACR2PL_21300 [Dehalococcoidia bacterium]
MSETALRQIITKINSDESFRQSLQSHPETALKGSDLNAAEAIALLSNDEDGLCRLVSSDVTGYSNNSRYGTTIVLQSTAACTINATTVVIQYSHTQAATCLNGTHANGAVCGGIPC